MNIINAILIFSIIIIIHELGHFLLAKKNGIFVTEFSIGMGPRIITLVKTEKGYRPRLFLSQHDFDTTMEWKNSTKYSWKLLPIGGSCIMMGEDEIIEDERAFNRKSVWARISVVFAGPLFNFLLAFILSILIIGISGYDKAIVKSVSNDSPAQGAGLKPGDEITDINGNHFDIGREFVAYLQFHPFNGEQLNITYLRNDTENHTYLTPTLEKTYNIEFGEVSDSSPVIVSTLNDNLEKAGIKIGDQILKLNNISIEDGSDLNKYLSEYPLTAEPISITYSRAGEIQTTNVIPYLSSENYKLGIAFDIVMEKSNLNILEVLKYSAIEVKYQISITLQSLTQLISGKVSPKELAGPVGIVSIIGDVINHSVSFLDKFLNVMSFCILLSANLGVMNLLPIPALDGGRLVFLILEVFRGKPVDQAKEGLVHLIGLVALMILMVFVMFNDISRFF